MKLFTKDIDNKLFKQYPLGNQLEKQKVVAKIFNPYGQGRWYLLNSDPEDPDYLWAIVQMGRNVEIGSVSRRELETIRVSPFRFPLERDLGFSPVNAYELWKGLGEGKFYKDGGWVNNENKEMLENQAVEIEHHAEELEDVLPKVKEVEPWVVAKAERAATDLSDLTHYLDGESRRPEMKEEVEEMSDEIDDFDRGGYMANGGDTSSPNIEFMKWFVDWSKSVDKYVYVSISIPNEFSSPIKDDKGEIVILDVIEKKGDTDAKKYLNEILKKADEFGVSIYLQPIPRTHNLKSEEHKKKITKDYLIKYYQKFGFEKTDGGFMVRAPKMAGGGEVKFKDKVKSVKESLLKRKKVAKKVQKDYGKTYSPKEAEESAKRIVGAMTAKEKLKMRMAKKKKK